jgi:hypothetical protein
VPGSRTTAVAAEGADERHVVLAEEEHVVVVGRRLLHRSSFLGAVLRSTTGVGGAPRSVCPWSSTV